MRDTILVVDDEKKFRDLLHLALESAGHRVIAASNGTEALQMLDSEAIDLVMTDLRMPGMDGRALLVKVRERCPQVPVVVVTAYASLPDAVRTIKEGAFDYISKPFAIDELELIIGNGLALRHALKENERLRSELGGRFAPEHLIGSSPAFQRVVRSVLEVAQSRSNVLLTGESGTGKEVIARAIHFSGQRRDRPFVVMNCAAIPEALFESELFGHVAGAFTGALAKRTGHFARADRGTLFLDEIGDMPITMQAKMLRVLQDRRITPVGSSQEIEVDVRIIAATNQDLQQAMHEGRFRNDIYYRLNVIPIELPPLRERRGDVALLARHFAHSMALSMGKPPIDLTADAMNILAAYSWPGNVRELQNCIERALISVRGRALDCADLPGYLTAQDVDSVQTPTEHIVSPGFDLDAELARVERGLVLTALEQTGGVQVAAARILGIKERSLWHRIRKLGIKFSKQSQ